MKTLTLCLLAILLALCATGVQASTPFTLIGTGSHTENITLGLGEGFSFEWEFIANDELPWNDYSYLKIGTGSEIVLASVSSVGTPPKPKSTGWTTWDSSIKLADPLSVGGHAILFGVQNLIDDSNDSTLNVRNFQINEAKSSAVPEPATLLGFGLPMLMVGLGKLRGLRK